MEKEPLTVQPQSKRNRYRLVVMNDDTYEEVVTFKLTRLSVYVGISTIFVVLVGFAVALLVFTPLRTYLPGSANNYKTRKELQALKIRTDSLEKASIQKDRYLKNIKAVLSDQITTARDTAILDIPQPEITND